MLLVGVFAVVITVSGGLLLADFVSDATNESPPVDLDLTVTETTVRLVHAGGDPVVAADVVVRLGQGGSESTTPLASWTLDGDGDDRFEPAERATTSHGFGTGVVEVLVYHPPTGGVLLEESVRIGGVTSTTTGTTTVGTTTTAATTTTVSTTTTTTISTTTTTPIPNDPPTASFTWSCAGSTCTFDGTGSNDPDGSVVASDWTFGDGNASSGETVAHSYTARGTYTVTLTVTDDEGATDTTSQQVDVVPYQPTLTGVAVLDLTANTNVDYRVNYDVDNTTEFDHVEVFFDNLVEDSADATGTNASVRGYVEYYQGGAGGDTYDITVRAYNLTGAVTDSETITDVADGDDSSEGNLTSPSSPAFVGTAVDDVSTTEAEYEVSYNVTNRSEFGNVRVVVEHLTGDRWAGATYTSSLPRDNVDDYAAADFGGTWGHSYRVTLELVDSSGVVVDEVVVTDTVDGTDPAGNDDLSRPTSPTLTSYSIRDRSNNGQGARYEVQYTATDNAEFAGVEVIFRNHVNREASGTVLGPASSTFAHQPGYGNGDQYDIEVRVIDIDGIVVDEVVASDVADGNDP